MINGVKLSDTAAYDKVTDMPEIVATRVKRREIAKCPKHIVSPNVDKAIKLLAICNKDKETKLAPLFPTSEMLLIQYGMNSRKITDSNVLIFTIFIGWYFLTKYIGIAGSVHKV